MMIRSMGGTDEEGEGLWPGQRSWGQEARFLWVSSVASVARACRGKGRSVQGYGEECAGGGVYGVRGRSVQG